MVAGIVKWVAQVAALSISVDGQVVAEAQKVEADEEAGSFTLHQLAVQEDHLQEWTSGGPAPEAALLSGVDGRGQVLFTVELDEARVRGYLGASARSDGRIYRQLTVVEPRPETEEEDD